MKKKTAFRIAAERFANKTNLKRGCCDELSLIVLGHIHCATPELRFFENHLAPTADDFDNNEINGFHWMEYIWETEEDARNDRILALLICEQIWIQEQKLNK